MKAREIIDNRREDLKRKRNENQFLTQQVKEHEQEIEKSADRMRIAGEALEFLESIANSRRGAMKGRLESVLTEALQLVYGPSRKVEIEYDVKNNRSNLVFRMVKNTPNGEVRRVLNGKGSGLGVSDTVSVPLRLLVLLGSNQAERICVLDECYRHLDEEKVQYVASFLRTLIERLGMQVMMMSYHFPIRAEADAAFHVTENAEGISNVEKL